MIYFLACALTNTVKIGTTKGDIATRVALIAAHSPAPLELVATLQGDYRVEAALHTEFSEFRLHNEWFKLEGRLRAFVCDIIVDGEAGAAVFLEEILARYAKSDHGTLSRYNGRHCRCEDCVAAARAYERDRRTAGHVGKWRPGGRGRPPKHAT